MDIKPIRSPRGPDRCICARGATVGCKMGSPEGDELEILALLIEKYEDEHYRCHPQIRLRQSNFARWVANSLRKFARAHRLTSTPALSRSGFLTGTSDTDNRSEVADFLCLGSKALSVLLVRARNQIL